VDLVSIVREAIESTGAERDASQQRVTVSLPSEPVWVSGDAVRLDQVFANLLTNASKFTRHGGAIWVTMEKERTGHDGAPEVVVRIRDNGMGIERALLPHIFDMFMQGDRYSDRARSGIGLGLTLAKRLVDLHG